jgi:hypothetical protein
MWKTEHIWRFSEGETKQCTMGVAKWQKFRRRGKTLSAPPPPPIKICPAPVSLDFLHMFCNPAWLYIFLLLCKKLLATFYEFKFVLIFFCFALLRFSPYESEPPSCMVLTTGIDYRFRRWEELAKISTLRRVCILFYCNKLSQSNPAAEPHGSPQGCTLRPRKGAGQFSMAQRGWGGGESSISHIQVSLGMLW